MVVVVQSSKSHRNTFPAVMLDKETDFDGNEWEMLCFYHRSRFGLNPMFLQMHSGIKSGPVLVG